MSFERSGAALDRAELRPVQQDWVLGLSLMQQTVLFSTIRGPDGGHKYSEAKMLLRWFRRCILLSALDGKVLLTPWEDGGGSFTGPSVRKAVTDNPCLVAEMGWAHMYDLVGEYIRGMDALPHHFVMKFMHAAEIVGAHHPDQGVQKWWREFYERIVASFHLHPELPAELNKRLSDNREQWLARCDPATQD